MRQGRRQSDNQSKTIDKVRLANQSKTIDKVRLANQSKTIDKVRLANEQWDKVVDNQTINQKLLNLHKVKTGLKLSKVRQVYWT